MLLIEAVSDDHGDDRQHNNNCNRVQCSNYLYAQAFTMCLAQNGITFVFSILYKLIISYMCDYPVENVLTIC